MDGDLSLRARQRIPLDSRKSVRRQSHVYTCTVRNHRREQP